jgi:hypothetical protein
MTDTDKKVGSRWDGVVKNASVLLGLLSTLLTIFIASTSYSTNRTILAIQAKNLETESKLKAAELRNKSYDDAPRVEPEIGVFNARAFATSYREQKVKVEWLDVDMRDQFERYVAEWNVGNRLMTGASARGLFLRQVVWLRLTNLGKTPARELRLLVRQRDFDNTAGGVAEAYDILNTAGPGWSERQLKLSSLMESGQETRNLRTRILMPLAHVSGGSKYFGRVFVPVKVLWKDERMGEESSVNITVASESTLKNDLGSAILGRSRTISAAPF